MQNICQTVTPYFMRIKPKKIQKIEYEPKIWIFLSLFSFLDFLELRSEYFSLWLGHDNSFGFSKSQKQNQG